MPLSKQWLRTTDIDDGWNSWNQICRDVELEFHCSPEVVCGKWRAVPAKQKKTSSNKKTKSLIHKQTKQKAKPNHKYTDKKQYNQYLGKQTNLDVQTVKDGSM